MAGSRSVDDNLTTGWLPMIHQEDAKAWRAEVMAILEYYTERTVGSFIEEKAASITWHYRLADPDYGTWQAGECQIHLENTIAQAYPVEIISGKKNIEVNLIQKGQRISFGLGPTCRQEQGNYS